MKIPFESGLALRLWIARKKAEQAPDAEVWLARIAELERLAREATDPARDCLLRLRLEYIGVGQEVMRAAHEARLAGKSPPTGMHGLNQEAVMIIDNALRLQGVDVDDGPDSFLAPRDRSLVSQQLRAPDDAAEFELILAKLDDPLPSERWRAADALGQLGDVRAIEPLRKLLSDPEDYVRTAAEAALKRIGS